MENARRQFLVSLSLLVLCVPMCMGIVAKHQAKAAMAQTPGAYTIYLTFDDGPSPNTEKVLNVLQEEDVPGTFFVVGVTSEKDIALYNRIIEDGHALGLHSFDHDMQGVYQSFKSFRKDFDKLENWIFEKTNATLRICRMVGGSHSMYCSAAVREQILSYMMESGYACFDWDIDSKDSGMYAIPAWKIAQNVIQSAKKKPNQDLIILMHDDGLRTSIADALKTIIPYFKEQGYSFDILQEDTESSKKLLPKSTTIDNSMETL